MNNPLVGLLQDDNGGASSTRFVFVVGSLVVIGVWAYLCLKQGAFVGIPLKDLGILVTLVTGKVGGKVFEVAKANSK